MGKVAVSNAQYPRPQHAFCSSVTQLCLPPSVSCLCVCLAPPLPPRPHPPNSNCRRTQLFHPPISKRFYHFLHFYPDFPQQKQFSYFCCFLTCELYWTDNLPGFHYRTDFGKLMRDSTHHQETQQTKTRNSALFCCSD